MIPRMYEVNMAGNDEELTDRDHLGGQGGEAVKTTTSTWDHQLRQMTCKIDENGPK